LELYNVETDIAERFNMAGQYPQIVAELQEAMNRHRTSFTPAVTQK
jgi:hypothetical protein